jgi:hypothetical protein
MSGRDVGQCYTSRLSKTTAMAAPAAAASLSHAIGIPIVHEPRSISGVSAGAGRVVAMAGYKAASTQPPELLKANTDQLAEL